MAGSRSGKEPLGATPFLPDRPTLPELRTAAQTCHGCELYKDATQAVLGEGPKDAALMLIGEQPGDQEDLQGKPFVGPAGRLLMRALAAADIAPDSVYRTNAVKHFRFSGTKGKRRIHKTPDLAHMRACSPWLTAELSVVKPTGVVVLGATAGKAILGSRFKVTEQRGQLLDWPEDAAALSAPDWLLATTHPSAVLRSSDRETAYAALVEDLKVAQRALSEPKPAKSG
jgi:uracil-DNA glycosylase